MKHISMDLDYIKYFQLSDDEIVDDLMKLKNLNVETIVLPYELFLNRDLEDYKGRLLKAISEVGFKLSFRAQNIRNYSAAFVSEKLFNESLVVHKQFIYTLVEELKAYNLGTEGIKIIFTGTPVQNEEVEFYSDKCAYFFAMLSAAVEKINVDILLELTQIDYRMGRLVGNAWSDFERICELVDNSNFGICWNLKASRINASEYGDALIPSIQLLDRVKIAIISNTNVYEATKKAYNVEMQNEEIKALIMAGFDGDFHLEYIYSYIHENGINYQNVWDSVEYLGYILSFYESLNDRNLLEITVDVEKLKRKSIRRDFTRDVQVILESNGARFNKIELSENDLKITTNLKFDLKEKHQDRLICKIHGQLIELNIQLIVIRMRGDVYDYVFKILNEDRTTRKKLCEILYVIN